MLAAPGQAVPDIGPGGGPAREQAAPAVAAARAALAGQGHVEPTAALTDLFASLRSLQGPDRAEAAGLLARPTHGASDELGNGYPPGVQTRRVCGPHVCVHYALSGGDVPPSTAWLHSTLEVMESVWTHHVDRLGFPAPAPDGAAGGLVGGEPRFDVYLKDIGRQGVYGYCAPEALVPGQAARSHGYCVLDNDFAEFPAAPETSREATAAHEFLHAIQFNLDTRADGWIKEATATWIEEQYADDNNDNRQFLRFGQLRRNAVPLDVGAFSGRADYGNWIFFQRLTEQHGVDAVRRIWSYLDSSPGARNDHSIRAIARFLRRSGSSFAEFYAAFAAANLHPRSGYAEGAFYPRAKVAARHRLGDRRKSSGRRTVRRAVRRTGIRLRQLTSHNVVFVPTGKRRGRQRLRIDLTGPGPAAGPAARVVVVRRDGSTRQVPVTFKRAGRGAGAATVRVPFAASRVKRVTLTVANASTRFRCGNGTSRACSGIARDEGRKYGYAARLLR